MLQLTEERFIKPESFFETYNKHRFEKLSGDTKVRIELLFNGQAARMIEEYEFNKADKLQWVEEGLLFERTAALTPEIIKWVLGFGAEVKVLEPADLRNAVVEEVNKMGKIYR